ncbi:LysR family transcriptional regulator [Variovorax rhizosphaerae]|uniref:LysR family transcriptional regulator n=1 Tax=Variovorax rhizosphaerae TaxID=1836200 RepID=A0ABU8WIC5_9BURK
MELRQLHQFIAVAETLNFGRAAERLHMAQPPLSVAIRKLEEEVGAPLFERQPRGVALTAAGTAALALARRCVNDAKALREAALAAAGGERGTLRVGFVGSATYALLPGLLPAFRARYPQVELVLRESANLELLAMVESGELDVGLVRHPTGSASELVVEIVERDMFCAVLPSTHALAGKKRLTLQELAREPFVDYASTHVPGLHAMVILVFQQAGLTPRVAQEATQVQTVISLVQSGMGVALVPSVSARLAARDVVFRPVQGLPASAGISLAMATRIDTLNPAAIRFREVALQRASKGRGAPSRGLD